MAQTSASHNLPTNRARELIKPSTDFAGLRLEIEKKNFFGLDFGFFVCYVPMRTSLCIFVAFTWLWEPAQCELFSLKVLLYLWLKNESLEPLIDLLAYLDRKLWLKNPVFGKNLKFSKKVTLATFVQLWPLVVCSQIELESYSNPLKTREVVYIRIKKNFQNFFGPFWSMAPWLEDVLRIFLWSYPRIKRADIVAQSFIGSRTRMRVFRPLDRLSSISGSKVRPETPKYFTDLLGHFRGFPN